MFAFAQVGARKINLSQKANSSCTYEKKCDSVAIVAVSLLTKNVDLKALC